MTNYGAEQYNSSAFNGTHKFIAPFTRALHLSLSLARPMQSTWPYPTSARSILILSTHLPNIYVYIHGEFMLPTSKLIHLVYVTLYGTIKKVKEVSCIKPWLKEFRVP
jgi:hypothetical protein